jgi:hypothetical protein
MSDWTQAELVKSVETLEPIRVGESVNEPGNIPPWFFASDHIGGDGLLKWLEWMKRTVPTRRALLRIHQSKPAPMHSALNMRLLGRANSPLSTVSALFFIDVLSLLS